MPTTINGIVTMYCGKKNLHVRAGVCEHCKREVELASYETRLWFTIVWVPIIPLGRKQVIDMCPFCQQHRVADWGSWQQAQEESLSKTEAALAERPDDPEAWRDRIGCLEGFGRTDEAVEIVVKMGARFSDDVDVQLQAAAWLEGNGRGELAQERLDRAAAIAPEHPDVRRAIGVTHCQEGRPDEARKALQFMFDHAEQAEAAVLVLLGQTYQAERRHREALACFAAARRAEPSLARDKTFGKAVRASEKR